MGEGWVVGITNIFVSLCEPCCIGGAVECAIGTVFIDLDNVSDVSINFVQVGGKRGGSSGGLDLCGVHAADIFKGQSELTQNAIGIGRDADGSPVLVLEA